MSGIDQGRLDALLDFYQTLTPQRIAEFDRFYAENAFFKDPFNEVRTLDDIKTIFSRMFRQVADARFHVKEHAGDMRGLFLVWDMSFRMKTWRPQDTQIIRGVSHLRFGTDGKVVYHRDYWDTGEELYAKLPLIGAGARLLRRLFG